jgi:CheY-like chemotaxis protein
MTQSRFTRSLGWHRVECVANAEKHGRRPIALIVDDDADTCAILSGFLQSEFEVLTVHSAHQCLQTLKRNPVDLVLLDLLMPETDGLATLREIRANPTFANTAVVVLTAWDDASALAEAKRLGAKECLIKPVFRRRLLRSVRTHLEIYR